MSREYFIIASDVVMLGQITLNIIDSTGNSTHFIFWVHQKILKTEKVFIISKFSENLKNLENSSLFLL